MGQNIYWALLGHTMKNGKIGDVEIIKVVEDDDLDKASSLDTTFYTTYTNWENKIIGSDLEDVISQLEQIKKEVLKHGVKFIKPGKDHVNNLDLLQSNQDKRDSK